MACVRANRRRAKLARSWRQDEGRLWQGLWWSGDAALFDVAALAGRMCAALRMARIRRISIRELSRLGDRDLRDMGIERHEIEASIDRLLKRLGEKG